MLEVSIHLINYNYNFIVVRPLLQIARYTSGEHDEGLQLE